MERLIKILKLQTFPPERIPAIEYILSVAIRESIFPEWWMSYAYDLGRIDGIRQERARRKLSASRWRKQKNGENEYCRMS